MRDAFIRVLLEHAVSDSDIFLITGDLGFKVLDKYREELPNQFLNIGIAEQNMAGVAAGLALEGRKVFIYSIGNFPVMRCLEHIRNDIAYHNANVKIVSVGGGFSYGSLGVSHHATEDLSIMRSIPNIFLTAPGDVYETEEIVKFFIKNNTPGYLRLDKSLPKVETQGLGNFEFGKARVLQEGNDISLLTTGGALSIGLEVAQFLQKQGIESRVLSIHSLKPIDVNSILKAAKDTKGVFTIEENVVEGGLGGAVAEVCIENSVLPKSFYRFGLYNKFCSAVGSQKYLRKHCGIDSKSISDKIKELIK